MHAKWPVFATSWNNPTKHSITLRVLIMLLHLSGKALTAENTTTSTKIFSSTTTTTEATNDGLCEPTFRLTECENGKNRWRVAVPASNACSNFHTDANEVKRLSTCDVSCPSGHHFNLTSLHCEKCQPGKFATGPTLRITDWNLLPDGMTAENSLARVNSGGVSRRSSSSWSGDGRSQQQKPNCQNDYGWQALGDVVGILVPSTSCVNLLYYPITLAKVGYVSFLYRYVRSSEVLFQFDLLHGCRSRLDSENTEKVSTAATDSGGWGVRWPNSTLPFVPPADDWMQVYVALPAGETTLKWSAISTTIGSLDDVLNALRTASAGDSGSQRQPPIQIRELVVDGLTSETLACTPCASGMFTAKSGSGKCEPCAQNFYANRGSTTCKPCGSTTFAPAGSPTCESKPPCATQDVTALVMESVNKNARAQCFPEPVQRQKKNPPVARPSSNRVSVHYKWSVDALCNPQTSNVILAPGRKMIQCGEICSPGMQLTHNHDTQQLECAFCPRGTYRSGMAENVANSNGSSNLTQPALNSHCQPCPANKLPRSGIWLTKFFSDITNWPNDVLNSSCYSSIRGGCFSQTGFRSNGDALVSQRGVDGAVMVLQVHVNGFDANMPPVPFEPPQQPPQSSSFGEDYYSSPSKRQSPRPQEPAIGLLQFEFEMHCQSKQCFVELLLADIRAPGSSDGDSAMSPTVPVKLWDYRDAEQGRIKYSLPFYRNASFTAIWTYSKFSLAELSTQKLQKFRDIRYIDDFVAFYSINITNAIGGGADSCVTDIDDDDDLTDKNATVSRQQQKLQCSTARGEYWDGKAHRCTRCSQFERLLSTASSGGKQFCVPCGHNLIADETRSFCYSPCRVPFGKKSPKPFTQAHRNPHVLLPPAWMLRKSPTKNSFLNFPPSVTSNNVTDSENNTTNIFDWQNFIDLSGFQNQPLNVKSADFNFEGDQSSFQYNFQFGLCGTGSGDEKNADHHGFQAECRENMSVFWQNTLFQNAVGGGGGASSLLNSMAGRRGYAVHGAVCRTSLVSPPDDRIAWLGFRVNSAAPLSGADNDRRKQQQTRRRIVSTAPVVLADELVGVYTSLDFLEQHGQNSAAKSSANSSFDVSAQQHEHTLNAAVDEYFWDHYVEDRSFQRGNAPDVHFVYKLSQHNRIGGVDFTSSHPSNRRCRYADKHVVITLQCVRDARRNGTVVLPPHCPTGTCDGCTYRFLMLTDQVCPPCIESGVDYREVVEQCGADGRQRVTRQPLVPFCRVDLPGMIEWRECSVIPRWLTTLILMLFLMMSLLMLVVLAQWNRTRTLQYKYSKLMAQSEYEADMAQENGGRSAAGGNSGRGQLPNVESCAMEVDDADEVDEDEFFSKKSSVVGSQTAKTNADEKKSHSHKKSPLPMREISLNDENTAQDEDFPAAQRVRGSQHSSTLFGRVRNLLHSSHSVSSPSPTRMQRIDELPLDARRNGGGGGGDSVAAAPPSRSGTRRSDRRTHSAHNRRHFYTDEGEAVQHHTPSAAAAAAAAAAEAARSCGIDTSDTAYLVANTGNSPDEDDRDGAHIQLLA